MPEFMGYDRAIVTFSPDGRLFQVEYAREAVKKGTTSLGVVFDKGVVLLAHRPISELAISTGGNDKIYPLDDHAGITMAGFLADGRILIDDGRIRAQIHKLTYDEPIDALGLTKAIADRMQLFTQYGGVRPYGVAFLLGGVDSNGSHLFEIDPSSAFYGWKAQAIGKGSVEALKTLKKGFKEKMSEDEAIRLAVAAIKAAEKGIRPNDVELAVINGSGYKELSVDDTAKLLKKYW
ncbi:MAG TPA: archaeal proteasome endopeptidase complex subunit alpha [archaeon]|nr:archaeal proteasome endopeptidase complex subunit alpha [archaeon]